MKKFLLSLCILCAMLFSARSVAQAPSVQASNTTISYKYTSGMAVSINWTRGNGQYCMVVMRKATSTHVYPSSGSTINWSASASYGSGSSLGSGDNFVMYKGTGTGLYIYNLTPNTLYDVYVYEYNTVPIFGNTYFYYNTSTSGAAGLSTLDAPPTACGTITSASSITNSSAQINFSAGNGDGRMITMCLNGYSASPSSGYYYSPSTVYTSGAAVGSGHAVYASTGTSVNVTGLAGATTYKAYMYEYNNGTYPTYGTYNYNTRNYYSCSSYTFNTTNIPPTLNSIPSYTVCQDAAQTAVSLGGIGDGSTNETQNLSVAASSSNTALIPNPTIGYTSPNSTGILYFTPNAGQYGTAIITVTVNDGWSVNNITTKTFTVTVLAKPGTAGAISGNSPICAGLTNQTYSISATTNTTGYTWLMPAGFTLTTGANTNVITVSTTTATTSGTLTVIPTNANGCGNGIGSSRMIQVDMQPVNPNAGPDQLTICGSNAALAATAVTSPDNGVWTWLSGTPAPTPTTSAINSISVTGLGGPNTVYKYVWTVTRSGSVCPPKKDTVTLTTDWNNVACSPAANFAYSPTSDVSSTKVCVGTTLNFTDLSVSANSWQWDFDYQGGAPNFTSSLQNPVYTYTSVGTYTVYQKIYSNATSQFYNIQKVITVIGAPAAPGTVFGTTSGICEGSASQYVYSVGSVTDATGYNWTTPTNSHVDAYPSATSIALSYPQGAVSGTISVSASNSCGTSGTSTLAVTISPLPKSNGNAISGPSTVCQAQNGVSWTMSGYSNASSYTWIDLNSAQSTGTSTFTMNIPANATNGSIQVFGNNTCGAGDTVTLNVTVNPLPGAASGVNGPASVDICPPPGNQLFTVPAIANATTYNWTLPSGMTVAGGNGADSIQVLIGSGVTGGSNTVSVYGTNACGSGASASAVIVVNTPEVPAICMVTVDDSSTHNIIYWDKSPIIHADSFRIYREDVTNIYHQIGTVHKNALSEFHDYDPVADPNTTTKRYKISAVDTCGNESALSPYHNTIYIVDNGFGQFSWNVLYTIENSANPVLNYVLMVDSTNTGNWVQIASTAGTQQNINDIHYNDYASVGNWRVETVWGISCTPNSRLIPNSTSSTVVKSKSNITNNKQTSGVKNNTGANLQLYPNPTNGQVNMTCAAGGKMEIVVTSLVGQTIYHYTGANNGSYTIDLNGFDAGTYVIRIKTDSGISTQRIIKQ